MRAAERAEVDHDECVPHALFLNTPTEPPLGADTWVHIQIVRRLDRSRCGVHVACVQTTGDRPTPMYERLDGVDDANFVAIDPGPPRPTSLSPGDVVTAIGSTFRAAVSLIRLARYIRRHDIAIVHTSDRPRDALASVLLSKITRARSIVHVHVAYADWMGRALRWSIRRADARIAVSEFVKRSLTESGMPDDTSHVVLNAIDTSDWTTTSARDDTRREFDIGAEAPLIITVCRLFEEKGPGHLIRTLAGLADEFDDLKLIIVGEDGSEGGLFIEHLRDLTHELGLDDRVIFAGRRADVAELMAAADIFAMPSFEEPFGLVFLEAMVTRLPIVALTNGGTPEVVVHGVHGLLSEPGDDAALQHNLRTLLLDPMLRRRMGAAGHRRVLEGFTVERMATDTADVYRRVVRGDREQQRPEERTG